LGIDVCQKRFVLLQLLLLLPDRLVYITIEATLNRGKSLVAKAGLFPSKNEGGLKKDKGIVRPAKVLIQELVVLKLPVVSRSPPFSTQDVRPHHHLCHQKG
jgi:hypothetical protein